MKRMVMKHIVMNLIGCLILAFACGPVGTWSHSGTYSSASGGGSWSASGARGGSASGGGGSWSATSPSGTTAYHSSAYGTTASGTTASGGYHYYGGTYATYHPLPP